MNKRGTDKILAIYWFLILIFVAGAVFSMVYTFYHHPIDVREVEAELLATKIADCLSRTGALREEVLESSEEGLILNEEFNKNFLKECSITFNVEGEYGWNSDSEYFASVEFFDVDGNSPFEKIEKGNRNLVANCEVKDEDNEEFERPPNCVKRGLYVIRGDVQYLVQILTIVKKTEKNVK
jgi:hypothetical protein